MRKQVKRIIALGLTVIMVLSVAITASAESGTWKKNTNGWWYAYSSGGYPANQWEQIGGAWYHFDKKGYMQTGWIQINGDWYYLDSSGKMAKGWKKISDSWYYFSNSGRMCTGWHSQGDDWYYLSSSGKMVTGWKKISKAWYYFSNSGRMCIGWHSQGDDWYYLDSSGKMVTGWKKISDSWYYFNNSGRMCTGWHSQGDNWYYLDSSGKMVTGWKKIHNKYYYFQSNGVMVTGAQTIHGKAYAFLPSGAWWGTGINGQATGTANFADDWYVIRSAMNSQKVMDAYADAELQDGTNIQICSYNGGANQVFGLVHLGDGWYAVQTGWGSKYLDLANGGTADETNILLWGWNGGLNQQWRFIPTGDGYYYIQSRLGPVADVYNFGTADETNIQSCWCNGGINQKWEITPRNTGYEKIEQAIAWGMAIANDNSHGYNMDARGGNPDYDCSSFVCSAFYNAGFNVNAMLATPSMRAAFQKVGFQWIPWSSIGSVSNLKRGDILLNENSYKSGHTEIYIGNNQLLGARGGNKDGKAGDSYGTEICVIPYSQNSSSWHGVLRYNGQ